jgi:hypothetical protein
VAEPLLSYKELLAQRSEGICEANIDGCGQFATQAHHRKMRSQGGNNELTNLMHVCHGCHSKIHQFPERSYGMGFLVRSHEDPATVRRVELRYDYVNDPEDRLDNAHHHFDGPGAKATCPTCKRTLPKPKDEKTEEKRERRTWSITVPMDEREDGAETLDTLLEECRRLFGHDESKTVRYFTLAQALALVVQHGHRLVQE